MPQRRLLYLAASHLSAWLWVGGVLREEARFTAVDDGLAAFSAYLRQQRGSNFYLLADIAEEGFHTEALPYTQGADRKALLKRKLGQYFYGSPLATTIPLGRAKTGRRDEKFLFAALTRPELLEPWLNALRAAEAPLAGVYSLPLLSAPILSKIPPPHPQCLLVTLTEAGIRQSFYEGSQLRFSRLTALTTTNLLNSPNNPSSAESLAAACVVESNKILQYLFGQRLVARGAALPVIILVHPAQSATFAAHCRNTQDLQFQIADLNAASSACGLKTLSPSSLSQSLFLHLLAQRAPREQFAPATERRFYHLWQARSALLGAGAVILLSCILFASKQVYQAIDLMIRTDNTQSQAKSDAEKYAAIQKTYPPMPASTEALRSVMNRYADLVKQSAGLEPLYLAISYGLQESPRIEIERIDWLLSNNPDDGASAQDSRKATSAAIEKMGSANNYAIAVINGTLPAAMAHDQRGQLEALNNFAGILAKDTKLKVTVLRRPFDIESGKSLKSSSEDSLDNGSGVVGSGTGISATQPKFVIHLSQKL